MKVIGLLMLIALFAAIFCFAWRMDGWKVAVFAFGIAGAIVLWVIIAVWLLAEG